MCVLSGLQLYAFNFSPIEQVNNLCTFTRFKNKSLQPIGAL